ncbi:TRAP transporter small permease [Hippea sp. KM1]|uniref:TRAP transporter small permease n=1 Tax=Hippea sp. KM1 TaxID=944481 RepID=UPI00046D3C8A|nr:TRAP transporter small permease [Hippea sp. KM1]
MMETIKKIDQVLGAVDKTLMVILASSATMLAFINVIARYVFSSSLVWAGELTTYLFIWMTLFGASYGFEIGMHMSFDALVKALPPKLCKFVTLISTLIVFGFLIMLTVLGIDLVKFDYMTKQVSIDLQIPFWIIYLVVPITMATASWRVFVRLIEILQTPGEKLKQRVGSELEKAEEEGLIE